MAKTLRFTFLLLISLIAFLALVPNAAMAAHIDTNLKSEYHVIEGDNISLEFRGGPRVGWTPNTGFAWKYGNPNITTTLDKIRPGDEPKDVGALGATITVGESSGDIWGGGPSATTILTINTTESDVKNLNGMKFQVTVGTEENKSNIATLYVYKKAIIESHPSDVIVFAGQQATFVAGPKPPVDPQVKYQWYRSDTTDPSGNYTAIPGANTTVYSLFPGTANDGYYYKLKISAGPDSLNNTDFSDPAKLTVLPVPTITPASVAAGSGDVTFNTTVDATNYVWEKYGGAELYSGTAANYTLPTANVTPDRTGSYTLTVTIGSKKITSDLIHLNVFSINFIDEKNTTMQYVVFTEGDIEMDVKLNELPGEIDGETIRYEWFFNGKSKGKEKSLPLTDITKDMAGNYEFKVTGTDQDENPHSDTIPIKLIVLDQPTVMPANVFEGNDVIFEVEGHDDLTYDWIYKNSESVANTARYEITNISKTDHEGNYSVNVSVGEEAKTVTAKSNSLKLTVHEVPTVALKLGNEYAFVGQEVTATVTPEKVPNNATTSFGLYQEETPDDILIGTDVSTFTPTTAGVLSYYANLTTTLENEEDKTTSESAVDSLTVFKAPIVTVTPETAAGFDGDSVKLTATVKQDEDLQSDDVNVTYQWYKVDEAEEDNLTKVGTNSSTYEAPISGAGNSYYFVNVTTVYEDAKITVPSNIVKVTGYTEPEIKITPMQAYEFDGENVIFGVTSDYTETTFEWYAGNGTEVGTGGQYEATADVGDLEFYVVATTTVTAGSGTITNVQTIGPATLTGYAIPEIKITPMQAYEFDGENVIFGVTSNYTETTFKWYAGNPQSGGTEVGTGGQYEATAGIGDLKLYVVATTIKTVEGGTITNTQTIGPATLTGYAKPVIEIKPTQAYGFDGDKVTFEMESNYTETTFEWYGGDPENGGSKVGKGEEYEATAGVGDLKLYVVATTVKTVEGGTITNTQTIGPATLTGYPIPEIEINPTQAYEFVGETATFEVSSTDPETAFEWYIGDTTGTPVGAVNQYDATAIDGELKLYVVATTMKTDGNGAENVQTIGPATLTGLELIASPSSTVTAGNTVTFSINGLPADTDDWSFDWYENSIEYTPTNTLPTLTIQNVQMSKNGSEFHVEIVIGDGDPIDSNRIVLTVHPPGPSGGFGGAEVIDNSGIGLTDSDSGEETITRPIESGTGFETKPEVLPEKTTYPWYWLWILLLLIILVIVGYIIWKKKKDQKENDSK